MDLTCYVFPGWEPKLRPASSRRDWMDATPERFAYRCLPLSIANAHGWELLSPCGFEARWTGGQGTEAVEIRLDADTQPHRAAVSLFGQGTVTFHVEGLFRTSPGWNLFLGGPPNHAKDGIAPLSGVIESDWSPYSFTMNWRFTRPDHWVRFERDEPIAFLFPVQRGVLDGLQPEIRPIAQAPELLASFKTWSASRDAFHRWVAEAKPSAPADKWQKLYYRGVQPDGTPAPADHEAKLRLAPFVPGEGTKPDRPAAEPRCPVAHTPAPAQPNTIERDRWRWLQDATERQRALSPLTGVIKRIEDITSDEFLDHFYAPARPVVLVGEMAGWPALGWTPDILKEKVGAAEIEYQGDRAANPDFELDKDAHLRRAPFDSFIDLASTGGNAVYLTAYNAAANRTALAPLDRDIGALDKFLTPGPGMLWIGGADTFTPLHFDLTNNLLAQIVGTKRITLLPPSEAPRLAHRRHVFSDVHDLHDPKRLATFPEAATARRFEVELQAGDLLFIPFGWWHQVRADAFSVMLSYTSFLWPNEAYASFPQDHG